MLLLSQMARIPYWEQKRRVTSNVLVRELPFEPMLPNAGKGLNFVAATTQDPLVFQSEHADLISNKRNPLPYAIYSFGMILIYRWKEAESMLAEDLQETFCQSLYLEPTD